MTTYEAPNAGMNPDAPPAPTRAPQPKAKRLKLSKLRSANAARIILGSVLALLLIITWLANNPGCRVVAARRIGSRSSARPISRKP